MRSPRPAQTGRGPPILRKMEEGEEHVQSFEAVNHAVGLLANAFGILGYPGSGQWLGEGGEENAPPHRRTVERHGQQARQNRYEQLIS